MKRSDPLLLGVISALLMLLYLALGPKVGVGLILGAALLVLVVRFPVIGLAMMILSGTAFQVLGSEHLTGLPLSLGKIAGIMASIAWLLQMIRTREAMSYSPQILWLAAFMAGMAISIQVSPDRALSMEGLLRYAQLFLLYIMIVNLIGASGRLLDQSCVILTASMIVSVFIGLMEFYLPSLALDADDPGLVQGTVGAIIDSDSVEGVEIKRITGGLSDSNWFAYTLAAVLPLNLYLFHRYSNAAIRTLILLAVALQSLGIVLSLTRTAIFAVVVSIIFLVAKRRLALAPVLVAGLIGSMAVLVWNPPGLQRIFSVEYLKEGSTPLRQYLLQGGAEMVMQRPVSGYGYSQFGPNFVKWLSGVPVPPSVEDWERVFTQRVAEGSDRPEWIMPHNTILQIWVEYGLLGILSCTMFIISILRDLSLVSRRGTARFRLLADSLAAGVWGFVASALFGHLALLKIIWILAALAAALRRVALTDEGPVPTVAPRPIPQGASGAM